MQKYYKLDADEYINSSLPKMQEAIDTTASNFSGTAFPTEDLFVGMTCYRTDENKLYCLTSDAPVTWTPASDLSIDPRQAIYDGNGNTITSTYATKSELSSHETDKNAHPDIERVKSISASKDGITYTKQDGSSNSADLWDTMTNSFPGSTSGASAMTLYHAVDALANIAKKITGEKNWYTAPQKTISDLVSESSVGVDTHNQDANAHPAIQDKIASSISSHNTNRSAHKDIRNKISDDIYNHNISSSAHMDIRNMIQSSISEDTVQSLISDHNTNSSAHSNLARIKAIAAAGNGFSFTMQDNKSYYPDLWNNMENSLSGNTIANGNRQSLYTLLDALAYMIKNITGESQWYTKPSKSLKDLLNNYYQNSVVSSYNIDDPNSWWIKLSGIPGLTFQGVYLINRQDSTVTYPVAMSTLLSITGIRKSGVVESFPEVTSYSATQLTWKTCGTSGVSYPTSVFFLIVGV